ncbi:MAG: penicillin acylase family protein [Bacteroidota bacterium]
MHSRLKIILGVLGTGAVLVLALVIFLYYTITKSYPTESGTIRVEGIHAETKIYRDEFGVPHVMAGSEHDAYFAVGYLHAQDRLWQLELVRRAGQGKLAEVLGERALVIDKMFRTLGIWQHAQRLTGELDEGTRVALQSYADGVSSYIATSRGKYPVEFDLLKIDPEPWTVEHSVLVSRLMAWELNYSRWVDIVLGELVERFGSAKAAEIFPSWPEDGIIIVPDALRGRRSASMGLDLLKADQAYRSLLGSGGFQSGSNAWAISGSKSVTGKPILANDPHLLFAIPARWYDLHVFAPGLDVAGASIVGTPFVVIGRNRSIAWGVTNAMMDDQDFYVEEVDSIQHPSRYRFNNTWRPVEQRIDSILVKDGRPVLLTSYRTHRGPIINRLEESARFSRNLLSMRWTGHEVSHELRAFYMINRASTWQEFREGLSHFAVPAQNFVYADTSGNIGYSTAGKLPVRKGKTHTLPFPGWTDEFDWKGFVPFEQMPQLTNPPEGFVATANNKIVSDSYPHYLSNLWEPPWRISRITELLRSKPQFSLEDMQGMQFDLLSPHAREVVPIVLKAFQGERVEDADVRMALTYFRNWNFEMGAADVSTTLFQTFFTGMIRNTLEDEMGKELLGLYDTLSSIPLSTLTNLMRKGSSPWFDDVTTPQMETMDDIIRLSLHQAIANLKQTLGGELKEWQWGRVHTVEFHHVFGGNELLRPVFNRGPYPIGGSHSTINNGNFSLGRPFLNNVGPSTRQIFDLADVNNGRAVTPPGQSGQLYHGRYDDQLELWLQGKYRRSVMDPSVIEQAGYDLLLLLPKR